jgi:hypothetical protein
MEHIPNFIVNLRLLNVVDLPYIYLYLPQELNVTLAELK